MAEESKERPDGRNEIKISEEKKRWFSFHKILQKQLVLVMLRRKEKETGKGESMLVPMGHSGSYSGIGRSGRTCLAD